MSVLIFLGLPILVWTVIMILSLPQVVETDEEKQWPEPESEEPPRFSRDYTGRLWVEKKRKGFFRPIRRRSVLPPGESED